MIEEYTPIVVPMSVEVTDVVVPMTVVGSEAVVPMTMSTAIQPAASDIPAYEGSYEVTPTREVQTLATEGKRMTGDVVVNPIPKNYGLITWNGSFLTVS